MKKTHNKFNPKYTILKSLRQTVCLLVSAVIVLCGGGVMAEGINVWRADYSKQIEILKLFDILDDSINAETLDENAVVSRADFALYMAKMLDISATDSNVLYYNDVAPTYYAYDSITALTATGYMSGVGNKVFRPNDAMEIEYTYKFFVKALGLGGDESIISDISECKSICLKLGVLDNVAQVSGELKLCSLISMIYNTLYTECYETIGSSLTKSDKTYMEVTRNVKYVKNGKVTCVSGMDLNGATYDEDIVIIDSVKYNAPSFDMDMLLGRDVEFIYKKAGRNEENEGTVIWIDALSASDTLEITVDPNCKFDKSKSKLYYEDKNGREKYVTIPQSITMIYNGRYRKTDVFDVFSHERYELTLIKTNGEYSTAIVWEYKNIVADNISSFEQSVTDKTTREEFSLEPNRYDKLSVIDSAGVEVNFENVNKGDVLSIYQSYDGEQAKVYLNSAKISETLTYVNLVNRTLKLGEETFEFYDGNLDAKFADISKYIGQKITVMLDTKGYIADFEASEGYIDVGFMINCSAVDQIGAHLKVKILKSNGKVAYLESADTFKIDDKKFTDNVGEAYRTLLGSGDKIAQMIGYTQNSAGEIANIYTAKESGDAQGKLFVNKKITKRATDTSPYDYSYYNESSGRLGRLMAIGPNTKIFIVPDDESASTAEDKYFRVGSLSEGVYENVTSYRITVKPEFFEQFILVKLILNSPAGDGTKMSNWAAMYDCLIEGLDSDGNAVKKVKLYTYDGAGIEVEVDDDFDFEAKGYKRGDVIRYGLNEMSGKLVSTETVYQPSKNIINQSGGNAAEYRTLFGYLSNRYQTGIEIGYDWGGTVDEALNMNSVGITRVVIYDGEADEIIIGTTADLKPFSDYGNDCSKIIAGTNFQKLMHVFAHR